MKLGAIADVHGNRVALEAVLADMPDVDRLVCAGDVVGYNPWHADCVDRLRELDVTCVQGNHDRAVAAESAPRFNHMARAGVEHARGQLDDDQLDWLAGLPPSTTLLDRRVRVAHGHPNNPDHYTRTHEYGPELLGGEDVLVLGHTHVQAHESFEDGVVVNPGSVGQPRDGDPRAAYAVVDLAELAVDQHRVAYDTDAVIAAVEDAGLPREIGFRLTQGR